MTAGSMALIRDERPAVINDPARLVTVMKQSGAPDIQRFDSMTINAQIDRQMSILPAGKTVAAIAYVDREGANVAVVGRINSIPGDTTWTILGTRKWNGDWQGSAALRWSI